MPQPQDSAPEAIDISKEVSAIAFKKPESLTAADRDFITKNHASFAPAELLKFGVTPPEEDGDESDGKPNDAGAPKDAKPDEKDPKDAKDSKDSGDGEKVPDLKDEDLEPRKGRKQPEGASDDKGDGEDDEETKKMEQLIEKKYGAKFKELEEQRTQAEIDAFVAATPDATPYRDLIGKYVMHKSGAYDHVPFDLIFKALDYGNAMKRGAKLERERLSKISSSGSGSGDGGTPPATVDSKALTASKVKNMSQTAFESMVDQVRRGHAPTVAQD